MSQSDTPGGGGDPREDLGNPDESIEVLDDVLAAAKNRSEAGEPTWLTQRSAMETAVKHMLGRTVWGRLPIATRMPEGPVYELTLGEEESGSMEFLCTTLRTETPVTLEIQCGGNPIVSGTFSPGTHLLGVPASWPARPHARLLATASAECVITTAHIPNWRLPHTQPIAPPSTPTSSVCPVQSVHTATEMSPHGGVVRFSARLLMAVRVSSPTLASARLVLEPSMPMGVPLGAEFVIGELQASGGEVMFCLGKPMCRGAVARLTVEAAHSEGSEPQKLTVATTTLNFSVTDRVTGITSMRWG